MSKGHLSDKRTIRPSANEESVDRSRERKSQCPTIGSSLLFFEDNRLNDNRKAKPKDHCLENLPAIVNDRPQKPVAEIKDSNAGMNLPCCEQ